MEESVLFQLCYPGFSSSNTVGFFLALDMYSRGGKKPRHKVSFCRVRDPNLDLHVQSKIAVCERQRHQIALASRKDHRMVKSSGGSFPTTHRLPSNFPNTRNTTKLLKGNLNTEYFLVCFLLPQGIFPWVVFKVTYLSWFLSQIKILRPECLKNSVERFITEKIGNEYIHSTGTSLKESYEESNARTPLILIHSHGKLLVDS